MPMKFSQLKRLHSRFPARRCAITGAGAGLGKALALELARHGWVLWLNDVDPQRLSEVSEACRALGTRTYPACFDVSDLNAMQAGAEAFLQKEAGVDLVFTCAGIGVGGTFLEVDPAHLKEVVDVNLMGTFWAGKVFLPGMVEQGSGHFTTIASAAAFHGMPHLSGYAATKAGVVQFSETIRSELQPTGVGVTTKMTTFYTSSIAEHTRGTEEEREKARSLVEMAPWSAEEVADALILAVQKQDFYMVAPGQAKLLWRIKRAVPEAYLRRMPALYGALERKMLEKAAARRSA